ncbi:MAG: isoprenyl transferase [Lachnospiraceae bacterium]|nr:isoprenyl transferase [Lachnospiraceae bacterium]MBR5766572.1 isoprenyl transferase [Lachnospiraceae bacterium]MBR6486539.1 isoprenyl transferase [Lachnospiraceae bacterium]
MKVPEHVAIILDGNGRWAKERGMPRNYGHIQGAKAVEDMCETAYNRGIRYLTVYAFSTENWSRPDDEVEALMGLLRNYLKTCIKRAKKNNMCVRVLGDKSRLAPDLQESIRELELISRDFTGLHFQVAINYGSRDEMIRAFNRIVEDIGSGAIKDGRVTEELFESYLDTAGIPAPDLLIRTSGEQRLSNFLLWQSAYTEFYFTDVHWPDFGADELEEAIKAYNKRDRRFGGVRQ